MAAHARLSASSADRWLHCPKSVSLCEGLEDSTSSFAAEGTLAHAIAEAALHWYRDHESLDGYEVPDELRKRSLYYEGMLADVEPYLEYVIARYEEKKGAYLDIEQRLDFSKYVPEGFGTGDAVIIADGVIEICDLKFGKGVMVDAENNPQLMLYGLGALLSPLCEYLYDVTEVRMTIVQPRLNHVSTFGMSANALKGWGDNVVRPIAEQAYHGDGEMCAGSWCRWCKFDKHGNGCRVRYEKLKATTELRHLYQLNDDEVAQALNDEADIKAWLESLRDAMTSRLLDGGTLEGFKLVAGRSVRKIKDAEGLSDALRASNYDDSAIYRPRELKTLTDLEKLVGKKVFAEEYGQFVFKPEGKPTLVPETDKRPPLKTNAADDFNFE